MGDADWDAVGPLLHELWQAVEPDGFLSLFYLPNTELGAVDGLDLSWEVNWSRAGKGVEGAENDEHPARVLQWALTALTSRPHGGSPIEAAQHEPAWSRVGQLLREAAQQCLLLPPEEAMIDLTFNVYAPEGQGPQWEFSVVAGDVTTHPETTLRWVGLDRPHQPASASVHSDVIRKTVAERNRHEHVG